MLYADYLKNTVTGLALALRNLYTKFEPLLKNTDQLLPSYVKEFNLAWNLRAHAIGLQTGG